MRVTDVLIRNLIDDVKDKSDKSSVVGEKVNYLDDLVDKIRSCGVHFDIWCSKKGGGDLDWTSLTGTDMKKLLEFLPDKLFFVIHNDTHEKTVKLWKDFRQLHAFFCSDACNKSTADEVFKMCKSWVDLFLSIGHVRKGYQCRNVTPYIHTLLYHIPTFVQRYGNLMKFSGQAVEKNNDIVKNIHLKRSNKHDAVVEALTVRKRLEVLGDEGALRERRDYTKRKLQYWDFDIKQQFKRISRQCTDIPEKNDYIDNTVNRDSFSETQEDVNSDNIENWTTAEIKAKLNILNIKTKLRNREKLLDLLKRTIGG